MSDHALAEDSLEFPEFSNDELDERALLADRKVSRASKFRAAFVSEFTKTAPRRDWLLKGALTARMLLLVVGEPGCGKSFLILDLIMNMALAVVDPSHSQTWFGRKIRPSGVAFIAGEGGEDFVIRMHAWKVSKGLTDLDLPVYLIPVPVDMRTNDGETADMISELKDREKDCQELYGVGFGVVVIDTVNKALAGGNDSKPEDVGPFLKNAARIKDQLGVGVIAIHHMPKNSPGTDPRGHGSLKGDNDGQWFVAPAKDGFPNRWDITRLKFGPTGARHEFRLRQVTVGADDDGDPITSCVVNPMATEPSSEEADMRDAERKSMTTDGRAIIPEVQTLILKALQLASETDGSALPYGKDAAGNERAINVPHGRKAITMARWTEEMVKIMPGDDKESAKFKDKCRKARDAASAKFSTRGIIAIDGDWVWRTGRRVAGVDRAEKVEISAPIPESSAIDDAPPF